MIYAILTECIPHHYKSAEKCSLPNTLLTNWIHCFICHYIGKINFRLKRLEQTISLKKYDNIIFTEQGFPVEFLNNQYTCCGADKYVDPANELYEWEQPKQ